jgi:UDPglucose 6-dehydrogenase/GDP-mannose 6-dehydrogenase
MRVCVFGAGYVGLVTAACLGEIGHTVFCVDVDPGRIGCILAGKAPIHEPGLEELIRRGLSSGRFHAAIDSRELLKDSEISIIAVGTPDTCGRIDLKYVLEAAGTIGDHIRGCDKFHTVVVKSTVIPGTTAGPVRERLENHSGKKAGVDFGLGMNPEFLREGSAVEDFMHPDRLVLGALGPRTAEIMKSLYEIYDCPKLMVHPTEAELIKYTANSLLATLISFSNEIFNTCEALPGVDGRTVLRAALLDRRWSPSIDGNLVKPGIQSYVMGGIGYGGSCFPKDMNAITAMARDRGLKVPLLDAVVEVNRARPRAIVERLRCEAGKLSGRKVAVLGMAFKPGTDDWRNSPSLPLIDALLEEGADVAVWDPLAGAGSVDRWRGRVSLVRDPETVLKNAHAALIATAWPEIALWPWDELALIMAQPIVYDGRNLMADFLFSRDIRYIPAGSGRDTEKPDGPI